MCGLTVAVPGEIMGYWELHQKYGKLPWYDLFKPTINLCREGIPVSQHLAKTIQKMDDKISLSPTMKSVFPSSLLQHIIIINQLCFQASFYKPQNW